MFVRNFLQAGDFLTTVPAGLEMTLQYNERGFLEKVFRGYGDSKIRLTSEFFDRFLQAKLVPTTISVKGGTTWVTGVLYTKTLFFDCGPLPDSISRSIESAFMKDTSGFEFYAGSADSLATMFRGANAIRNWLLMSKFKVLPGWIVPTNLTKEMFYKKVQSVKPMFAPSLITSYIIYRKSEVIYKNTGLKQYVVKRVSKYVDDGGFIKAKVVAADESDTVLCLDYSDVLNYSIQAKTCLVTDNYGTVCYASFTGNRSKPKHSSQLTCRICGKTFTSPTSGPVCCSDVHCRSRMYPQVNQFLRVLNLPLMRRTRFDEVVGKNLIQCVPDVLQLDEYKECSVTISLATLLSAIVPLTCVADTSVFNVFANKCTNTVQTFQYYVHHSDKIAIDLELGGVYGVKLVQWLRDPYNQTDIDALLESPQIKLTSTGKRFEGAPIFRDKLIMITGQFTHGTESDIRAILESYSAKVTTEFSSDVNCVVYGSTMEGVDGQAIRSAGEKNIPVYSEPQFFSMYEIDKDLAENLV